MKREEELYSPSTEEVVRQRAKRICEKYVGSPMNYETLNSMRAELQQLVRTYMDYGELRPFPLEDVRVFTDPSDPRRLLVKIGRDSYDPFS